MWVRMEGSCPAVCERPASRGRSAARETATAELEVHCVKLLFALGP